MTKLSVAPKQPATARLADFSVHPQSWSALSLSGDGRYRTHCVSLGAAYQNANDKYANSADDHLEGRAEKRCVHVMIANPANDQELDRDDQHRESCCRAEIWNQVGK